MKRLKNVTLRVVLTCDCGPFDFESEDERDEWHEELGWQLAERLDVPAHKSDNVIIDHVFLPRVDTNDKPDPVG